MEGIDVYKRQHRQNTGNRGTKKAPMKQWINNLTLAKKMLVLYIAGILVPILFLSWLSTVLLQFFVDRREDENLRTAMIRVAYSIENAVVSAKNLAIICGSDEEVMDIVSRKYLGYGDFYDSYNEEITSRLLKYDQAVDDVEGIEIYSDKDVYKRQVLPVHSLVPQRLPCFH